MANSKSTAEMTTEELKAKLNAVKKVHLTIVGIFVVIVLAWILLGYWLTNLPVFISTIVMALGTSAAMIASRSGLTRQLKKREEEGKTRED